MRISNVLISDSWGELNPDAFEKGVGGREGAMMYLSREWARLGHEVTNFVNISRGRRFNESSPAVEFHLDQLKGPVIRQGGDGYHEYLPLNMCRPMLANQEWDAVVAWETPSFLEEPRIRENVKVTVCEMQVAHFAPKEMQAAEAYCDYVAALSPWHAEFLIHSGLDMPDGRVVVFPNGVDLSRYPKSVVERKLEIGRPMVPPKFVYSSSPDRGLWPLLQSWKEIRKTFPGATLSVAYGVDKLVNILRWMHGRQAEMAVEIERLMTQPGIRDYGKIGQGQLSQLQHEASAWLYPLDSIQATETGCITAVENAAAGNPIITTDCDCMEAEFGSIGCIVNLPFNAHEFAQATEYVLTNFDVWADLVATGREFAESRDWQKIAPQWLQLFKNHSS